MKRLLIGVLAVLALVFVVWFLAGFFGFAGEAQAGDIDCFTQQTYNGTRTTCYYGFPDYERSITTCDASRCTTNWA